MADVKAIWNTDQTAHENELLKLFKGAVCIDFVVAFARRSGLDKLRTAIKGHLKKKENTARFILGLDFCQTEPAVLKDVLELKKRHPGQVEAYVYESEYGSCFHRFPPATTVLRDNEMSVLLHS